jgi:hypothetical protein
MAIIVESWMGEDLDLGVGATSKTHASGGTLPGHQISLSTFSVAGASGNASSAVWDPGTIANGGSESTTIDVPGAALGDFAIASFSLDLQGLGTHAYVSAPNVVTVLLMNLSGGVVNLSSGTLKVLVFETR